MPASGLPSTLLRLIITSHTLHHNPTLNTYTHPRQILIPNAIHHSAMWPAEVMGHSFASPLYTGAQMPKLHNKVRH